MGSLPCSRLSRMFTMKRDCGVVPLSPSWLRMCILNGLEFYVNFYLLDCLGVPEDKPFLVLQYTFVSDFLMCHLEFCSCVGLTCRFPMRLCPVLVEGFLLVD